MMKRRDAETATQVVETCRTRREISFSVLASRPLLQAFDYSPGAAPLAHVEAFMRSSLQQACGVRAAASHRHTIGKLSI
jgi:hypothetical protein